MNTKLKDGGVYIDWASLTDIRAWIYSDAQKALAGRADVTIDQEDSTKAVLVYAGTKAQYPGINRLIIQARYNGSLKTYDRPVFNFVARTAEATGNVTIDDPETNVEIEVQDVSSSILDATIAAAITAAVRAEEAAAAAEHMVDIHQGPPGPAGKAPYIDETTGSWFVWDDQTEQYVDSGSPAQGPTGNGIASWSVVESQEDGGSNVVTVVFTNGDSESFTVKNGNTGATPNLTIGTVETGAAGSQAEATINGTAANPVLNLRIPQGAPGVVQAKYVQVEVLPTASASTMDALYLVPSELNVANVYDVYYTSQVGRDTYSWIMLCTTQINLADYATKEEVAQLELKVDDLELAKSYTVEGGTSPNLFDKTTMIDGFISENYGSIGSNEGSKTSAPIPVIPGHYYLISGRTLTGVYSMRCLDANLSNSWMTPCVASTGDSYAKFALPDEAGNARVVNGQFKVPSGAAYVQITIKYDTTNGSPDAVMVTHLGDTYSANPPAPEYQPYGTDFKIKRSALPESLEEDLDGMQNEIDEVSDHFDKVESPNLFNKDNPLVKSGYYSADGVFHANVNHYSVTHPIALKAGVEYKAVYPDGLGASNTCIAIVDADNNPTGTKLIGTISGGYIIVTPSSDVLVSYNCGYDGEDTLMVCKSADYPAEYTPYYSYTRLADIVMDTNLTGKSVIFTGDSICQATLDTPSGAGWAKRIGDKYGMIWQNKGINGGTLIDKDLVGSSFTISDTDFGTGADYIILEGGTNDADRIGSIIDGTTPAYYGSYSETGYSDNFTNDTFCGAVEYLLKKVVSTYPTAKVGFIIAPKMGVSNDYTKEGNNRRAYFETIIKLCKKWGVPVLNLWDECTMNPKLPAHYTADDHGLFYYDGQHPVKAGYDFITPIIEAWMETL